MAQALLAEAEALCRKHPDAAKGTRRPPSPAGGLERGTPDAWFSALLALIVLSMLVASCW